MISITKLLCGALSFGDELRYAHRLAMPVVVWNVTRKCNLSCIHCYTNSRNQKYTKELSTVQARKMLKDLAGCKVPALLFSGGEPLLRKDILQLAALAKELNIRTALSTNGTLIDAGCARRIKEAGIGYVGVSLDGIGKANDRFRGQKGAFDLALAGIRNLVAVGVKTGIRFTLTKQNYRQLTDIFNLCEKENIERVCFYHLVYAGRAQIKNDLTHRQTRQCMDLICGWAMGLYQKGGFKEILTVDNHADAAYIYLKVKKNDPVKAQEILRLLRMNGGNASGLNIVNIDNRGFVHPDQFWQTYSFGNVRKRNFSEIWQDNRNALRSKLKNRKLYLKGRCQDCRFLDICNGNFRARAEAVCGDIWQEDPACYLTDQEIQ